MISPIDISNRALAQVNESSIIDIEEDSIEAHACRLYYDEVRRNVISDGEWGFCKDIRELNKLSKDDPLGWNFAYRYPIDSIKLLNLFIKSTSLNYRPNYNHRSNDIYFETGIRSGVRVLLTNIDNCFAAILVDVIDENLMPPLFIEAMTWRLSSYIAVPILGVDKGRLIRNDAMSAYRSVLSMALANNVNDKRLHNKETGGILEARGR